MTTTADSVNALADILQTCANGKEAIADALTSKGVPTAADDSFDTMAVNVGLIEGGDDPVDKFRIWYSDDNVNWIPFVKNANWDKAARIAKGESDMETFVAVNGTSITRSYALPVYFVNSGAPLYAALGGMLNGTCFVFGNAEDPFSAELQPPITKAMQSTMSDPVNRVTTRTVKAGSGETSFPTINKISFYILPSGRSGSANAVILAYCKIPPFQLSTTVKTFYIKFTY